MILKGSKKQMVVINEVPECLLFELAVPPVGLYILRLFKGRKVPGDTARVVGILSLELHRNKLVRRYRGSYCLLYEDLGIYPFINVLLYSLLPLVRGPR